MNNMQPANDLTPATVPVPLQGPLPIMADLRDIMAATLQPSEKLNEIVRLIAGHLNVDVCSIYMCRFGDILELFATVGLNPDAVNKTRLSMGEGIIGHVAQHACPISINDARKNPRFAPRPETDEDAFNSFCAVPVMRNQKVRGVLAIQSRENEIFPQEIIETLQTIAMVLAEFIASGEIISRTEMDMDLLPAKKPTQLTGDCFSRGLAIGPAVVHQAQSPIKKIIADDPEVEKLRLKKAITGMKAAVENLLRTAGGRFEGEMLEILQSYRMFAEDRGWQKKIEAMIDQGLTADAAVQRAQAEIRNRFKNTDTAVLRDKAHDIDDLSSRLLQSMDGQKNTAEDYPEKFILVAKSLSAAALFDYGVERIQGIVLTGGNVSGHVSIIAKSLGIPLMGQCKDVIKYVRNDDMLILDTDHLVLYLNPSDYIVDLYQVRFEQLQKKQHRYRKKKDVPAMTRDGHTVNIYMNAGLLPEMPLLRESGAAAIGLFRTELSFMGRSRYPLVSEQAAFYKSVMDQADGKPVTFRTLDIGGDKPLPYFNAPNEENPAMGWRAMRIIMDRPAVLRTQMRALILGAEGRPLRVMLPFVSDVSEIDHAKKLINMEFKRARERGIPMPEAFELGVMIEVPALLWQLDRLFKKIDFAAVGTNDLMQYLFAADSRSDALQDRYDLLSSAMLSALGQIATKAKEHKVPVCVCGEAASKPLEAMALLALGFDSLSMPVSAMGEIKDMINSLDLLKTKTYVDFLIRNGQGSCRKKLMSFAKDHKVKTSL